MSWSARILLAMLGTLATLILWAFVWEPGRLVVRSASLELPGWGGARPVRAALLADLHVGSPRNGIDNLRRVIARTNGEEPDIVLIAGDLVIDNVFGGSFVPPEDIAAELADLAAPLGVYAVLGNHDRWLSAARVTEALESHGITVVENRAVRVESRGLWIAGVSDYWTGHPDLEGALADVTDDAPVLMLTHNPDIFPEVPSRVSLTLAGHTHGGQVVIPIVGRAITPSRYGERYAVGHVVEPNGHVFVTSGVGTSRLGVRFLVPPEVAILEIQGCDGC
ncbi:MAG: metallophosphoesterase [Gemmatimonadota bacterium]|nr:metallophosphoesterase [Gemmatimonadota bacterium]